MPDKKFFAEGGVKPGRMLKASTQVASRLLRDKMWAIFSQGIALTNTLYDHFIFSQPVPKKETGDSALKLYKVIRDTLGAILNDWKHFRKGFYRIFLIRLMQFS